MSDTEPRDLTDLGQLIEMPPSVGWVVHQVVKGREADGIVWAWCKVGVDEPGYTEVLFTKPDGSTVIDGPTDLVLGPVITKLWC